MVSFRAVIDGIDNKISDRRIEKVIFDKSRTNKLSGHLSYIKAMSYKHGFQVEGVSVDVIDSVAVGSSHGGIITYTTERTLPRLTSEKLDEDGFYVYLDGIEDPYNFGYALRSVYAAGANGVILSERNWMSAAGVVCRASAGASEQMNLLVTSPEECVEVFKARGYKIVCADIENSISVYDADMKYPILLAVGGEKRGLSRILSDSADQTVRLDYGREFKQAMSAASAASVLAFEVFRVNR